MNLSPRRKFLAFVGVAVLICALGGYGYFTVRGVLVSANEDSQKVLAERDVLDLQLSSIKETNAALDELADIQSVLPDILPPEKVQSDVVSQIIKIGEENNIAIQGLSFTSSEGAETDFSVSQTQPLEGVNGIRFLTMGFNINTTFDGMIDFFKDIESNQRLMQIESIDISFQEAGEEEEETSGSLQITMEVSIYVRADS